MYYTRTCIGRFWLLRLRHKRTSLKLTAVKWLQHHDCVPGILSSSRKYLICRLHDHCSASQMLLRTFRGYSIAPVNSWDKNRCRRNCFRVSQLGSGVRYTSTETFVILGAKLVPMIPIFDKHNSRCTFTSICIRVSQIPTLEMLNWPSKKKLSINI